MFTCEVNLPSKRCFDFDLSSQVESPSEQHARKERSARLQEDAARTLGERARYFSSDGQATAPLQVEEQFCGLRLNCVHFITRFDIQQNKEISVEKTRVVPASPSPPASNSKVALDSQVCQMFLFACCSSSKISSS